MNFASINIVGAGRGAALLMTLGICAALIGGCTVYANGTEEWDDEVQDRSHEERRPPPRSVVPVSRIGREVQVYLRDPGPGNETGMRGRVRDLGDWVRLDRDDGSTILIPREQIRYIEPVAAPSTTQP